MEEERFNLRKGECMQMDAEEIYGGLTGHCCIKIHHGGNFVGEVTRKYEGGEVHIVDMVELSCLTYDLLRKMVIYVGNGMYSKDDELYCHFKYPGEGLKTGLRPMLCDDDVKIMREMGETHKCLFLYVEHGISVLLPTIELIELQGKGRRGVLGTDVVEERICLSPERRDVVDTWVCDNIRRAESGSSKRKNREKFCLIDEEEDEEVEPGIEHLADAEIVLSDGSSHDDKSDTDYVVEVENNEEAEDKIFFDANVDDEVEWYVKANNEKGKEKVLPKGAPEFIDWDDFQSNSSGDFEDDEHTVVRKKGRDRYPQFNRKRDMVKPKFVLSQQFGSKKEIKAAIKQHSIDTRRELKITKNDKNRIRAICEGFVPCSIEGEEGNPQLQQKHCPWTLLASQVKDSTTWQIKTLNDEHWCLQSRRVRACTAKFLASTLTDTLKRNPTIPVSALKQDLEEKYQVNVSRMKAFRAKMSAHDLVVGGYKEQFAKLRDYCHEVMRSNPGTTIKIEVEPCPNAAEETRIFKRVYCCLGPLKKGFNSGCRPVLGLDGTFLKGPFPGQILTAIGIDSNNSLYPLAYAIVEIENMKSWEWFLDCIGDDLGLTQSSNFCFITDRQKGLIPALAKVFPAAEHRYCLKHIWDNFKTNFKGLAYKDLLWSAATATNVPYFEKAMNELKLMDVKAWEWLAAIPAQHWSKSHFSLFPRCDILYNNLCETFNSKILDARDKPIVTCMETIREYMMDRIVTMQQQIERCHSILCPNIQSQFDKTKEQASALRAKWNGGSKYQVSGPFGSQCVVDLQAMSCTCRRWDLTGIPCKHAIRSIWSHSENGGDGIPENWVDACYKVITWRKIYENKVEPIKGPAFWAHVEGLSKLVPPIHRVQPGRPRKARKKSQDELASQRQSRSQSQSQSQGEQSNSKHSKKGGTVRCHKCGNTGHNSRTCKGHTDQTGQNSNRRANRGGEGSSVFGHASHANVNAAAATFNNGSTYRVTGNGSASTRPIFTHRGGMFSMRALFQDP